MHETYISLTRFLCTNCKRPTLFLELSYSPEEAYKFEVIDFKKLAVKVSNDAVHLPPEKDVLVTRSQQGVERGELLALGSLI